MLKIVYRFKKDSQILIQAFFKFINPSMFILQDIIRHSEKERNFKYKTFGGKNKILEVAFTRCYYKGYSQMQPPDVFCEKGVLKNFAKFIGKQ